ncbi:hypothetical protein EE612_052878 [Oryza sativa]|nr:hypothetical protein EE612_052878 [Oryza sativa]
MDAKDFPVGHKFRLISHYTHCDGLVLAPDYHQALPLQPGNKRSHHVA